MQEQEMIQKGVAKRMKLVEEEEDIRNNLVRENLDGLRGWKQIFLNFYLGAVLCNCVSDIKVVHNHILCLFQFTQNSIQQYEFSLLPWPSRMSTDRWKLLKNL